MSRPDAPILPPDRDGPVFAEPWEAQAFALTLQLQAAGAFTWAEWADALSGALKTAGARDDGVHYYEHWLAALESLVAEKALTSPEALSMRKQAWAEAYRHTAHGQPVELSGTN